MAARVDVPIDTTFAVYNRQEYFIGGVSLLESARHIPWYYSEKERKADKWPEPYFGSSKNREARRGSALDRAELLGL